jgi:iron complex outermembrane recepter protein
LFEVNLNQAAGVSVLRGPGGLGHASGGLHGVIDVRTRSPLSTAQCGAPGGRQR